MSLVSVLVFIIILLVTTVKTEVQKEPYQSNSIINFKDYVSNVINNQSSKMQALFEKIQTNARTMLKKLDVVKHYGKKLSTKPVIQQQVEAPEVKRNSFKQIRGSVPSADLSGRSYNSYATTGYGGPTGNSNSYAPLTYHHHSIGFDPVNIVISVSLLSFILQTITGLLSRITMPATAVVEARNLDQSENWMSNYEKILMKPLKVDKYMKRKYLKLARGRN